jgi:signal transduction histidine kinase
MVQSAAELFGGRAFAGVYQLVPGDLWQLVEVADDGRVVGHRVVEEGSGSDAFERLAVADQRFVPVAHLLDEIEIDPPLDHFGDEVRAIGLDCGWGVSAVILVDDPDHRDIPPEALEPVLQTWSAALAAAARHESAKRLTEQLAEANHELLEAQQELTRRQTLARVGAIAAGAAHEMNNPLTVIAGRSQLLAQRLTEPSARQAAEQIAEQAHRLSDLISALMRFASPAVPRLGSVDAGALARSAAEAVTLDAPHVTVEVNVSPEVPTIFADPEQLSRALEELVRNALESEGTSHIWADVQMDPLDDRLMVQITDDGAGLSEDALTHAFDPFYSAKPAGRQPGLGLAEVQRVVEAHDGRVSLRNGSSGGAVATIWLPIAAAERRVA